MVVADSRVAEMSEALDPSIRETKGNQGQQKRDPDAKQDDALRITLASLQELHVDEPNGPEVPFRRPRDCGIANETGFLELNALALRCNANPIRNSAGL